MITLHSPEFIKRRGWWGLVLLGLFAIVLRMIAIGQESFWTDEVLTLNVLHKGVWQGVCEFETSPPLFFLLLKGWSFIFGEGHVALRTFAALAGSMAVPALWLCARRWGLSPAMATLAALMLAISPFAFINSQQNRYYTLLMLFGVIWVATLPALMERAPKPRIHWPFVWAGLACFFTHYYSMFLFLGGGVGLLLWWLFESRDPRAMAGIFKNFLVLAGLAAFDTPLFLHQLHIANNWWQGPPNAQQLRSVFTQMFWVGPSVEAVGWRLHLIEIMRNVALLGYGVYLVRIAAARGADEARRAFLRGLIFACFGILPILAAFAYSRWVSPVFIADRYPILFLPGFILWVAAGWDGLPRRVRPLALPLLLAGVVALSGASIWHYWTTTQMFDWRGSIRTVEGGWRDGDAIVFCPTWMMESYINNGGNVRNEVDSMNLDAVNQSKRVWLIMWEQAPAESKRPELQKLRHNHGDRIIVHTPDTTLSLIDLAKK